MNCHNHYDNEMILSKILFDISLESSLIMKETTCFFDQQ